jgi:hypothetical protein
VGPAGPGTGTFTTVAGGTTVVLSQALTLMASKVAEITTE